MKKISAILLKKNPEFHTVSPDTSVENALNQMCCENIDYLVVSKDDDRFIGLLTEHDIASKVVFMGRKMNEIRVKDVMERRLPAATTEDTVEYCMQMMRQHNIRYLPVFENFLFYGIVSSDDILEVALNNRQEMFDEETEERERFQMLI